MKFYLSIIAVVVCLVASIIPIQGTDVWYSQFVAVTLFGMLSVAVMISEMSIGLGILFAYFTFSTVFVTHQDTMSLVCLMQTALCLLMAVNISRFDAVQRKRIWWAIFGVLTLQMVWGFVQFLNIDPIFKLSTDQRFCDTVGFSGSHNQYGLMMAAASPALLLFPWIMPILFVALILSKTFTAMVGFVVAQVFLFRKKINIFVIILAVLAVFSSQHFLHKGLGGKFDERYGVWRLTVNQVLDGKAIMEVDKNVAHVVTCNPWFGFGFQKFFTISPYTQRLQKYPRPQSVFEHAHNDYVEALFDLGKVGFILVLLVLSELVFLFTFSEYIMSGIRTREFEMTAAGLLAFAVCAGAVYSVHTAYNGFFLCVLLGLFYGEVNDGKKRRK